MKESMFTFFVLMAVILTASVASASKDEALAAIEQAKIDIQEMRDDGLPVTVVNDLLNEANQALDRAEFAVLVRQNATGNLGEKARNALEGLDYEGFSYDDVIAITTKITDTKEQALEIVDSISVLKTKIQEYEAQNVDTYQARIQLNKAEEALRLERFNEAEELISETQVILDARKAELTTVNLLLKSSKGFLERYWLGTLIFLLILSACLYVGWRIYRYRNLSKQYKTMLAEQQSLISLIKKNQYDRFKTASISSWLYKARSEKYQSKLNELKENLPVIKAMIDKQERTDRFLKTLKKNAN